MKKSDLKTLSGPRVSTCGLRGETPPGWPRPCRLLHDVLFSQAGSSGFRVPSTRGKGCSRCTQPEGNAIPGFDWSESRRRRSRQSDPRAGHRVLGPPPVQGRDACNHGWVTTTAHTVLVPGCLWPQSEAIRRIVGRLAVHEKDTMVEPGGGGRVLLNPSSMRSPLGTPLPLSAKHDACLATCQLQSRVRGMD